MPSPTPKASAFRSSECPPPGVRVVHWGCEDRHSALTPAFCPEHAVATVWTQGSAGATAHFGTGSRFPSDSPV